MTVSITSSVRSGAQRAGRLFTARSVALVGASARPDSVGEVALRQLVEGGFTGRLYPVNPRYDELGDLPCFATLADVPDPVDLAIFAVPDEVLEQQLGLAAEQGVRAAVVFGGYSALLESGPRPSLAVRLGTIAREAEMALCGPNGMGFIDFHRHLRAVGYYEPLTRAPGPITFLSQSGSVFSAVLHNTRGLEFDLAVSTGQESGLSLSDYLMHALERETTGVVGLFLETLRDGPRFAAALQHAIERDVPVVALKVGRSPASEALVRAHSGGLAGDDGAFEALFDAYGVARVRTLDELMDTLELFGSGRRAGSGGIATVHDSGGERAHLADLVDEEGLTFARINDTTRSRIEARLDGGLAPMNPLDAWGSGRAFETAYRDHLLALHDDPDTAVLALAVDLTTEAGDDLGYVRVAREVHEATVKPFVVLTNLTSGMDRDDAARVRASGVPVLEGTGSGLAAIRHLIERRDMLARPAGEPTPGPEASVRTSWQQRLSSQALFSEAEALALLRDYGIPVVPHRLAATAEQARDAAEELTWPVVLKTAAADVDHKSDVGGVHLDLRGPDELRAAYDDIASRLGPEVLVSRMVPRTTELALGLVRDPQIGPVLVVAAGGTLVELLHDRQVALPPIDGVRARRLLERLTVWPLLDGARGREPADVDAVVATLRALSNLAGDLGGSIAALDVNPLLVGPDGCVAVDALVVPAEPESPGHLLARALSQDAGPPRA